MEERKVKVKVKGGDEGGIEVQSSGKGWQPFVAAWMSIRAKQREITRLWCPLSMI